MGLVVSRRIADWAVVLFGLFYLLADPGGVAGLVHGLLDGLRPAGQSLSHFVSSL
jgi:hypothetical protein